MKVLGRAPVPVPVTARADIPQQPFDRVARLAAMVLGTPLASVTIAIERPSCGRSCLSARQIGGQTAGLRRPASRKPGRPGPPPGPSLCQLVIDSQDMLIIEDARLDHRAGASCPSGPASEIAWAGYPVHDPAGHVVGALHVSDHVPRHWSTGDVELLEILAAIASSELALQVAVQHGAERAALAQTLQESLLPPRLPKIPGVQVAARYAAGGTGVEVLGDFYDVFPSVRGSWGLVVGDVCGKGVPAAKSTALARYTLRAEAHRQTRPALILAALNQALLDWLTDDPRFLTAIYATVRPTLAGASVTVSSAGHPLALVRRADGRVQTIGRPGTLLGLLAAPELHDTHGLLRAGDSLILFTDGVTEARSHLTRDLYGDGRLGDLIAGLGELSAEQIADAIQQAVLAFGGGASSDDTVALVLKVPGSP